LGSGEEKEGMERGTEGNGAREMGKDCPLSGKPGSAY